MMKQVDDWFEQYREFVEGDSRRGSRPEVPISVLRESVEKVNAICVNFGSANLKISKILSQAEKWYSRNGVLLERCRSREGGGEKVSLESLKEAVEDADSNIGVLDLEEANELQQLLGRIESWFERATVAIGGKKLRGKHKFVFKLDDLKELVREGNLLPIEASKEIAQLESTVRSMNEWQVHVTKDLAVIATGYTQLKESIDRKYGDAASFSPVYEGIGNIDSTGGEGFREEKKQPDVAQSDNADQGAMDVDVTHSLELTNSAETLIKTICQDAKSSCMVSDEGKVDLHLEDVSRWTARSLKYVENPREIFDTRFLGHLTASCRRERPLLMQRLYSQKAPFARRL